jgi:hypothetical protein
VCVIFLTFERDKTNLRGTLVENVKKAKISVVSVAEPQPHGAASF